MQTLIEDIVSKLISLGFFNWWPDIIFIKFIFRLRVGYKLNLKNPQTFNEKLQWLKLYDFKPEYTQYVDKYAVREYIAKTIGAQYLKPLLGVYQSTKEIDWDKLPDKFVLKCTSGSGGHIVCQDKNKLDKHQACKQLDWAMKRKYFYNGREYPYKNIQPKIICEEFIFPEGAPAHDYDVYCFNGQAKLWEFHVNIHDKATHTCDYYDRNLNKLTFTWDAVPSTLELPSKELAKKILELSEILTKDFCHARVDWYIVGSKIYFGEITFYNWGGFGRLHSYEDDLLLGSWLKLPNKDE